MLSHGIWFAQIGFEFYGKYRSFSDCQTRVEYFWLKIAKGNQKRRIFFCYIDLFLGWVGYKNRRIFSSVKLSMNCIEACSRRKTKIVLEKRRKNQLIGQKVGSKKVIRTNSFNWIRNRVYFMLENRWASNLLNVQFHRKWIVLTAMQGNLHWIVRMRRVLLGQSIKRNQSTLWSISKRISRSKHRS